MDDRRFDSWTRSLGAARSRRQLLRTFAGTAVGGALAVVGRGAVAAANDCPRFSLCWFGQRATADALKHGGIPEGSGPENEVCKDCDPDPEGCPIKCAEPYVLDESACDCVCPMSCPEGKWPNADCTDCVCTSDCGAYYDQDPKTCECVCPDGESDHCGYGCRRTPHCEYIVPNTYLDDAGCDCLCPETGQPICATAKFGWVCCPSSAPFCRLGEREGGNGCYETTS